MLRKIDVLSVANFAIGTDLFIIAGLLPNIAHSFSVSPAVAGQLVTVFAWIYALASPILAIAAGTVDRKKLIVWVLLLFAAANVMAAISTSYYMLLGARVLAACCSALLGPNISAFAAAMASPEQQGRALAISSGGVTLAGVLGLPIGTLVGGYFGWPASFLLVTGVALIAVIGVSTRLPVVTAPSLGGVGQRIKDNFHPSVLTMLTINVLAFSGFYAAFTYIAPIAHTVAGVGSTELSGVLLIAGIGGLLGIALGGIGTDHWSAWKTQAVSLMVISSALLITGQLAWSKPGQLFGLLSLSGMAVLWWGASWALSPSIKKILLFHAPHAPAVVLSLSNSANYLGIGLGGALGGIALQYAGSAAVGFLGGGLAGIALIISLLGRHRLEFPASQ